MAMCDAPVNERQLLSLSSGFLSDVNSAPPSGDDPDWAWHAVYEEGEFALVSMQGALVGRAEADPAFRALAARRTRLKEVEKRVLRNIGPGLHLVDVAVESLDEGEQGAVGGRWLLTYEDGGKLTRVEWVPDEPFYAQLSEAALSAAREVEGAETAAAALRSFMSCLGKGPEKMLELFAEDGQLLESNGLFAAGKDRIRSAVAETHAAYGLTGASLASEPASYLPYTATALVGLEWRELPEDAPKREGSSQVRLWIKADPSGKISRACMSPVDREGREWEQKMNKRALRKAAGKHH